jgi:hypothetical protein
MLQSVPQIITNLVLADGHLREVIQKIDIKKL